MNEKNVNNICMAAIICILGSTMINCVTCMAMWKPVGKICETCDKFMGKMMKDEFDD